MGGAVSTGDDNDELVDNLVDANYIKFHLTERVFRAVDRADYFLPDHRESAYKDLAWKHGHLHLSAPCIYSEVLDSLELQEGQSFLNLGSGTGYLSTMAGLVLGSYGVNHGIEVHEDVVDYAREKLEEFKTKAKAFEEFDFAEPLFVTGNCLQLNSACRLYDRVYCGAACPSEHENYMRNLIKVGGILVMPLNDQLLQIKRVGETDWTTKSVLPVSFATLISPSKDKPDVVDLPEIHVLSLQEICRHNIRKIIRTNILTEHPTITRTPRKQRPQRSKERRGRLVNIVPMQMGMMILNSIDNQDLSDDDDDIDDDDDDDRVSNDGSEHAESHSNHDQTSHNHLHFSEEEEEEEEEGEEDGRDEEVGRNGENGKKPSNNHNHNTHIAKGQSSAKRKPLEGFIKEEPEIEAAAMQSMSEDWSSEDKTQNKPKPSTSSTDNKRCSPSSLNRDAENDNASKRMRCLTDEEEEGEDEEKDSDNAEEAHSASSSPMQVEEDRQQRMRRARRELSSEDSDIDNMDLDHGAAFNAPATPTSVLNALHLLSIPRKLRCSSSTSADTSETSGFGSFGEEPDMPGLNEERDSPPHSTEDGDGDDRLAYLTDKIAIVKKNGSLEEEEEREGCSQVALQPCGPTLGQLLKERVDCLPLPQALRSFLKFYRN